MDLGWVETMHISIPKALEKAVWIDWFDDEFLKDIEREVKTAQDELKARQKHVHTPKRSRPFWGQS